MGAEFKPELYGVVIPFGEAGIKPELYASAVLTTTPKATIKPELYGAIIPFGEAGIKLAILRNGRKYTCNLFCER